MFRMVSIDVGTRNLSWAILDMKLPDPGPGRHKELKDPIAGTIPCGGFYAPWHDCHLVHLEIIDILQDNDDDTTTNSNLVSIGRWIPMVHQTFRARQDLFRNADVVLIESQPNFGREKIKMVSVMIHSFFTQYFADRGLQTLVSFASSSMKLQVIVDPRNFYQISEKPRKKALAAAAAPASSFVDFFGPPKAPTKKAAPKKAPKKLSRHAAYKQRKQEGVILATQVLQELHVPDARLVDRFFKAKKQDDYADCLLQGIAYLQRCPPAKAMRK